MKSKALLIVLFALPVFALAAGAGQEVVTFEASKGNVTFKHRAHQDRVGADKCNTCHHTSKADGSDVQKCDAGHPKENVEKDGKTIPSEKNARHKKCKGCHKTEQKGPTKCDECHVAAQ